MSGSMHAHPALIPNKYGNALDFLFKQRLHFVAQAIGSLSFCLPLAEHDLDRLRLLAFKLGPIKKYIHRDEKDPLPDILRELAEIADSLKVQPI